MGWGGVEVSRVGVDGGGFFRGGGGWRRDFGGFPSSDVIPELAVFFFSSFSSLRRRIWHSQRRPHKERNLALSWYVRKSFLKIGSLQSKFNLFPMR